MGASSSGGGAGGNTGADAGFFISEKKKKQKINERNLGTSDYQGDIYKVKEPKKKNKVVEFIKGGGVTGAIIGGLTKGEEVNRKFYEEKVVPAGKSKAPNYETYMKDRLAGKTDAYGNPTPNQGGGNNNNNQPVKPVIVKKNIGGTEVQTTEAKLAEEKAADDEYDMRKTKRRGRRQTILTSQTGARGNLVLGKPSLLGA